MRRLLLAAILLIPVGAFGEELVVSPSAADKYVGMVQTNQTGKWLVLDSALKEMQHQVLSSATGQAVVFEAPVGIYAVLFFVGGDITKPQVVNVTLAGGPGPGPDPKPDPDPDPDPKPDPKPDPNPPPIPVAGLYVMIVWETGAALPEDQVEVINATAEGSVRAYLNSHCAQDAAKNPQYRILDDQADVSSDAEVWKKAFARARQSLQWIIVSNGKEGFEGPLPATVAETLTLLKKYGGE